MKEDTIPEITDGAARGPRDLARDRVHRVRDRRPRRLSASRCRPGRQEGAEGDPRREARVPHHQDPPQRHDRHGPVENAGKAGLRRVIDEETVKKVLAVLSDDVSEMPKNWNRRFKHNRDKIKTGDIYELAEVVRNLAIREQEKGLSTGEKQMYTRAKKILASELMYALEKDEERGRGAPRRAPDRDSHAGRRGLLAPAQRIRWRSPSWWPPAAANALVPTGPRRSSCWRAGRCSSGRSTRSRAAGIEDVVVALPEGEHAPAGLHRRRAAARPARRRCAPRWPPRRPRSACVVHDAARPLVTPELFARHAGGAGATPTRRSPPRRSPTRSRRPGPDRGVVAHAGPLARCGRSRRRRRSAARRCERALDVPDDVLAARHRRRLAGGARGRQRAGRRGPARELQGHDPARPRGRRAAAAASDADRLPRPPAPGRAGHPAEHYFTAANAERYREAADGARDRRARRLRAHLPLPRRAGRVAPPVLAAERGRRPRRVRRVRARGDRPAARHRGGLRPRPRGPDGQPARRRASGTTSSARCTSCATTRWTSRTYSTSGAAASRPRGCGGATSRRSPRRRAAGCTTSSAHPDLVKVWGRGAPRPDGDLRRYYEPAVEAFAESGVAVEVSTAGLRKPVERDLPGARASWRWSSTPGCPIALSSDAHVPDAPRLPLRAGAGAARARSGVREMRVFEGRARRMEPIG